MRRDFARVAVALTGALAWAAHLTLGFVLTPAVGEKTRLHVLSLVCLLVTALSVVVGHRQWNRENPPAEGPPAARSFVAMAGIILNLFFLLVIATQSLPAFILRPGD
jgi:hypothetical protein